jgi:hypothetical protein
MLIELLDDLDSHALDLKRYHYDTVVLHDRLFIEDRSQ